MPDKGLQWLLVLVLQLHPLRRPGNRGDSDLVDITDKAELPVPTTDVQPGRRLDVQQIALGPVDTVEHSVHVDARLTALEGVHDVSPFAHDQRTLARHVAAGEVAVHPDVWWTAEPHLDLAISLFVSPGNGTDPGLLRLEPDRGGVRARPPGENRQRFTTVHSLAAGKVTAAADDPRGRCRTGVFGRQRSDRIRLRLIHVPDSQVAVGCVEHRGTVGLARRIRLAPVQLDLLVCVAGDSGDAYPNSGFPLRRVPGLDLIRQRLPLGSGDAQVLTLGPGLLEVEGCPGQAKQQREVIYRHGRRQVGTLWCREDGCGTGVCPVRIGRLRGGSALSTCGRRE